MKRLLSFLVALFLATTALWAYDFKEGDFYYKIIDVHSVEVATNGGDICYQDLEHVNIPASVTHNGTTYAVTRIGDWAFSGRNALKSVDLPSTLQSIGYCAFRGTRLNRIQIPENVKRIEGHAFGGIYSGYFQLAILTPHTPPTHGGEARSFPDRTTIVVHKEDTAAYRAAGYGRYVTPYGLIISNPQSTQTTFSGDVEFVTLENDVLQEIECFLGDALIAQSNSNTFHISCTGLKPSSEYTITMRAKLKGTPEVITQEYEFTTQGISVSLSSPQQTHTTISLRVKYDFGDATNKGINGIQYCIGSSFGDTYTTIALNKTGATAQAETTLTGLQPNTTYCARAYVVINEGDTIYGGFISIATKTIATAATITRCTQTKVSTNMQYDWGDVGNVEQYGYEIVGTPIADTIKAIGTQSEIITIDTTFAGLTLDTEYTLRTFIETRDSTNAIFSDDFSKGISDWSDGSSYYSWFKSVDGACAYSGYPWSPVDGTLSHYVSLTGGIEYTIRVLVKKAMASGANIPNVAIKVGDSTIVTRETLSTEYEQLSGVFTPTENGDYRIGLYVYMNDDANIADTVYFDDFAVLLPASMGKMPITINNEQTFKTLPVATTIASTKRTQTKLGVRFTYDWGEVNNIEKYGYGIVKGEADTIQAMGTIDAPIEIDTLITGLTPNTEYTFRSFMETRDSTNVILSDDFYNGIDEWEQQTSTYGKWTAYGYTRYCKFQSDNRYQEAFGWLFHRVNLIGGAEYTFRVRVKKGESYSWYANPDMAIGIGNSADSLSMTTIVSKETLSTEYEEVIGTYTPIKSGIYYVGLYGHTSGSSSYYANTIYFDDFLLSTQSHKVPIYIRDKETFKTLPVTANIDYYSRSRTQTTLSLRGNYDCGDATNTVENGIQWSQGSSIGSDYTIVAFNKADSAAQMETTLTGLQPNTTYCARVYIVTAQSDTIYSDVRTYTTESIDCNISSTQTHTTISLAGSYDCGDATNIGNGIQYNQGLSLGTDYTTVSINKTDSAAQIETSLTGLQPNTTYCARAYVVTVEGDTTYSSMITCTTKAITTITSTTTRTQTKLGVSFQYDWGNMDNITRYGYEMVGTSIADTLLATGVIAEPIKIDTLVTGLTPNTEYTFRTFIEMRDSVPVDSIVHRADFFQDINTDYTKNSSYGTWSCANGVYSFQSSYSYHEADGTFYIAVELNAGVEYKLFARTRKRYSSRSYTVPDVKLVVSTGDYVGQSYATIASNASLSTEYQEIAGTFTPTETKTYYLGIYGHVKDPGPANASNIIDFDEFSVSTPYASRKEPRTIRNKQTYGTLPVNISIADVTTTQATISVKGSYDCGDATNTGVNGIQYCKGSSWTNEYATIHINKADSAAQLDTIISDLQVNTNYALRAFIVVGNDTTYSTLETCKTKSVETALQVLQNRQTKAICHVTYDAGDAANVQYGIEYCKGTSFADRPYDTQVLYCDSTAPSLSIDTIISGLVPNTQYAIRSFIEGEADTDVNRYILSKQVNPNDSNTWKCIVTDGILSESNNTCKFETKDFYTYNVKSGKTYRTYYKRDPADCWLIYAIKLEANVQYYFTMNVKGFSWTTAGMYLSDAVTPNSLNVVLVQDSSLYCTSYTRFSLEGHYTPTETKTYYIRLHGHIAGTSGWSSIPSKYSDYMYYQSVYFENVKVYVKGTQRERLAYGTTQTLTTLPVTISEPTLTQYGQTYILLSTSCNYGDATLVEEAVEYGTSKSDTDLQKASVSNNMVKINNILPDTRYYYRSLLTTVEGGTIYSDWQEMTTKAITLSTGQADGKSANSVFLHGTIDCDMESRTEIGFEWKRSDAPATVSPERVLVIDRVDSTLIFRLEGLSRDKYYDYRTFCLYKEKTYYGEWVGFLTADDDVLVAPSVQTLGAEATETGVTLKGFVVAGTENIIQEGFESWRVGSTDVATTVSTGAIMTNKIPEPWSYTDYQYRAYAKTPSGTTYGETKAVTTGYIHTDIQDVVVTPSATTANVTWTIVEQANYYILTLFGNAEMTDTLATYTVDTEGNITQRRAPAALRALVNCNIDQLTPETDYFFTVIAYNADEKKVAEENGTFATTPLSTDIDDIIVEDPEDNTDATTGNTRNGTLVRKIFRDGQVYILRGDKMYTLTGVEVK